MLSISAEDEVEVVEEDPYEEEIGADSTARRAKNHPLFQQRQPAIPTTAWGAAAQLGLAGMAANAAGAAATAQVAGQTTAAQQLQQAAAAYGAASSNTTAGAALAMAQARGGAVPVAAQHSFSFWPTLAVGGVAAAQHIIQQKQAQSVQAQAQAQQQQSKSQQRNGALGGNSTAALGGKKGTDGATPQGVRSPSLGLTAASLGMSQDQLAAVLGGGGLAAGMQGLQQQQAQQKQQQQQAEGQPKKQVQMASSLGVTTGSSATGASVAAGTGGVLSDNMSTCSSLSGRDQVASALRQAANSSNLGKTQLNNDQKMKMALDFLRTESASLLKRCMLMAGFEPSQTEECDMRYLEFAEKAAEEERNRIARIRDRVGSPKDSPEDKRDTGDDNQGNNGGPVSSGGKHQQESDGCARSHAHSDESEKCFDGRHGMYPKVYSITSVM
uniref:Uncharacterized protein n=1 Tax=Odontella aurita TaxID=265563 RepID=A0A7S4JRF8_9STRA|mmetsp:Transcript_524/g.1607  ORF Transcript_524/g.1607 Transcript_524/m.1607 type:complete len:441 (+) Transcript_524:1317-2639(+)